MYSYLDLLFENLTIKYSYCDALFSLFFNKSGEYGNKKDLINVSMAIAEASVDVTNCARALGKECTDRRMKTVCLILLRRQGLIWNCLT